jgi:hypothetical protein
VSFVDLDTVKEALGITDTSKDALLTAIVDGVNAEFLHVFCLTSCDPTAYTNTFDVLDSLTREIMLPQYPVISLDEVKIDDSVLTLGDDYYEGRPAGFGVLLRKGDYWPVGQQRVEVTHTAGWAGGVPPADLQRAAVVLAVWMFNTEAHTGFVSERIGQYAYKLGSGLVGGGGGGAHAGGWPAAVVRILANHRRAFVPGI